MELAAAGLQEQPFRTHGKSLVFVEYEAQSAASRFLQKMYSHPSGLGLFAGPSLSGKSTILRRFVESMDDDIAVAIVDGAGLNATAFLKCVLDRFGYDLKFNSINELLNMLRVFVLQQTASGKPPLLIIENTQLMNASALRTLCDLATLRHKHQFALRMILASERSIESIVTAPALDSIGSRMTGSHHLQPLTETETRHYLHAKLRAGGAGAPESILPDAVCRRLHQNSGGWPGVVDRLVLLAIAKASSCPITDSEVERPALPAASSTSPPDLAVAGVAAAQDGSPQLYLTLDGETLEVIPMDRQRLLIGRTEHNDLCINSKFVSRHHALFVCDGGVTLLMDLNSTNGTFVNSRRISNHVMRHDDVVSLGQHRIKFVDPAATGATAVESVDFAETVILKSLQDIRRLLAQENTVSLPTPMGETADKGSD